MTHTLPGSFLMPLLRAVKTRVLFTVIVTDPRVPFVLFQPPPRLCDYAVSNTFAPDNIRHPEGQSESSGPRLMSADLTETKPQLNFSAILAQLHCSLNST